MVSHMMKHTNLRRRATKIRRKFAAYCLAIFVSRIHTNYLSLCSYFLQLPPSDAYIQRPGHATNGAANGVANGEHTLNGHGES